MQVFKDSNDNGRNHGKAKSGYSLIERTVSCIHENRSIHHRRRLCHDTSIKNELDKRKWIGEDELPDIIALAQSAPGILAVNVSIFAGYKIKGLKGSITATLGSILPSFLIILAIAMAFTNFKDNPTVISIFKGIRPVVVALIASPMISMARKSDKTWWAWCITGASLLAVSFLSVSPIYIILTVLVLSVAVVKLRERR